MPVLVARGVSNLAGPIRQPCPRTAVPNPLSLLPAPYRPPSPLPPKMPISRTYCRPAELDKTLRINNI